MWCTEAKTVHPAAKMSKQKKKEVPPRNTILQLSTPYTDSIPSNPPPKITYLTSLAFLIT